MAKCGKCSTSFEGRPEKCPGCGAKLAWGETTATTKLETETNSKNTTSSKEEKLESSSFLEKYVYVIRSLNFLPVIGWVSTAVVGVRFRDYKKSLKENRRHAYKKFMKSGIFWGLVWLAIAVAIFVIFKTVATDPATYNGIV